MKKIFYIDFYGNRYAIEETGKGARLIIGGYLTHIEKHYKSIKGAKIALGLYCGGLDSLRITNEV